MKKFLWVLIISFLFLLTGCEDGEPMPYREVPNQLSARRMLILTRKTEYVSQFLPYLENRARQTYSLTIDDTSNILEYNFAYYNCVLVIETLDPDGSAPVMDNYMQIYSGSNNIVLHGLDYSYAAAYPLSVVTANAQNLDKGTLQNTAEKVFSLLRTK